MTRKQHDLTKQPDQLHSDEERKTVIIRKGRFTHCPQCAKPYDLRPEGKLHKCEEKRR